MYFHHTYPAVTPNKNEGKCGFALGDGTLIKGVRGKRCDTFKMGEIYAPMFNGDWPYLIRSNTELATLMKCLSREEVEGLNNAEPVYIKFSREKHPNGWSLYGGYYQGYVYKE